MVAFNPLTRQPTNLDFASPSQFRFTLLKVPNVEYFVTGVNLPGVSFSGDATINTRFTSVHFMGDSMEFEDLEVTFLINEALENYREIHDWMVGIGFPKDNQQYIDAIGSEQNMNPIASKVDTAKATGKPSVLMSDATLTILTNKNNPNLRVNFKNCFPTSLSGLSYNTQGTDTEQLTATVTFKYDIYEFQVL
tara:strand:+ start:1136 stop:1714 length:579 start_codon:yes stop_codon:yes gene_type:complete